MGNIQDKESVLIPCGELKQFLFVIIHRHGVEVTCVQYTQSHNLTHIQTPFRYTALSQTLCNKFILGATLLASHYITHEFDSPSLKFALYVSVVKWYVWVEFLLMLGGSCSILCPKMETPFTGFVEEFTQKSLIHLPFYQLKQQTH